MDRCLDVLAARPATLSTSQTSPDGLPERYVYSADHRYRYAFARWWAGDGGRRQMAAWVLLNPATGDTELRRRPTLERCLARTRSLGLDGLVIVNLFSYRHTDPRELRRVSDPVGPETDLALSTVTAAAAVTIVAWGGGGRLHGRSAAVTPLLTRPLCLGTTAVGEPRHPLYVPSHTALVPWEPPTPGRPSPRLRVV